ncbi:MAG: transcriptional regulator [Ignavibacteria bacterium]|nr:transcriptional regulator [Ignavibacteria bacterium]
MKKHISYRSSELLNEFNKKEKHFFTLQEAMKILLLSEPAAVRKLLADMTKRGLILRIRDGLYNKIPYEKNSEEYFPNWHLTAEAIMQAKNYYISFYSALDIHGLITQPSLKEQIVTEKQVVPKYQNVKKMKFEFITLNKKRFFGYKKTWIDDYNKIYCSDLEKTIVDCLYKPNYANGITEIVKAIYKSKDKIKSEKMMMYLEKFDAQVVYKRLGFILKHLEILTPLIEEIQSKLSNSYTLLDPALPKDGKHYSEWKLLDNVGIESALKSIRT